MANAMLIDTINLLQIIASHSFGTGAEIPEAILGPSSPKPSFQKHRYQINPQGRPTGI